VLSWLAITGRYPCAARSSGLAVTALAVPLDRHYRVPYGCP
jgi:hypothetical protein